MRKSIVWAVVCLIVAIGLVACGGGGNSSDSGSTAQGDKSVMNSVHNTAPISACQNGGITVDSGVDTNGNGILDPSEVKLSQYVCNGTNGATALASITTEPTGTNCTNGGNKINVGLDTNGNGVLDSSEITSSDFICNGVQGSGGTNGASGYNSLLSIVSESSGTHCANGGYKVLSGLDANRNNVLDLSEITSTNYVCNGSLGSYVYLTSITVSPAILTIAKGPTQQFAAIGTYSDGTTFDLTKSVTWSSSNTTVATISNAAVSNGAATTKAPGTTSITATLASNMLVSGSTTLTVTPPTLVTIAVTPTNQTVAPGTTLQFTATGTYTDYTIHDLTTNAIWSSSANTVATISNISGSNGNAASVNIGSASITATIGGISGSTSLSVSMMPPTNVIATKGNKQNTVTWNPCAGATSYNIYWSTTSPVTKSNGTRITNISSPFTQTGLSNGTTYSYVVTADYSAGESAESLIVNATPLASPVVLASGLYQPWGIAVDSTNAYTGEWRNTTGTIKKIDLVSGTTITTIAAGRTYPEGIAVDGTNVYFADNGISVNKVNINGGPVTTIGSFGAWCYSLAVDATYAYCAENTTGNVKKMNLNSGVVSSVSTGVLLSPIGIAVDATSLYVTDSGSVYKIDLNSNSISTLVTGLSSLGGIAVDTSYAYFVYGGALRKVSISGGTAITIGTGISNPGNQIAGDANYIYYADSNSTVYKISK